MLMDNEGNFLAPHICILGNQEVIDYSQKLNSKIYNLSCKNASVTLCSPGVAVIVAHVF